MFRIASVCFIAIAIGCSKPAEVKNPAVEDKVTFVDENDPKMNAARDKARSTVDQFIMALKAPNSEQRGFSVKKGFSEGSDVEHMWLTQVTYNGTEFEGVINNDPQIVTSFKIGQKAKVSPTELSDWMFIDKGKLVGGYSLRVLRDAMPTNEKKAFDQSIPFVIE